MYTYLSGLLLTNPLMSFSSIAHPKNIRPFLLFLHLLLAWTHVFLSLQLPFVFAVVMGWIVFPKKMYSRPKPLLCMGPYLETDYLHMSSRKDKVDEGEPLKLVTSGLRKEKDLEVFTWGRTTCEDGSRERSDACIGQASKVFWQL